ncbi:glycosyltransferase family 4 protein [Aurantiacibacter rhizosphaerae]|uniref:Glycosyltransferase n=1 Tax=Aurantiacibacter rhizosphaerae TaxID=2691582 RepID=A0A844XD96_9SPHN|nr:glycosyltransferase family 4 protein [Aurantiacibacter rhizosphaerae]MWV27578.1 glycosyltransferase [Aurantiacibacter rhizosphaerae]
MNTERKTTVCLAFAGDRIGGSHISLKGLLDALPRSQYRIIIVPEVAGGKIAELYSDYDQVADPGAMEKPFAVGRNFGIGSALRTLPRMFSRARMLKELGVDIVHTNDGRSHASWAMAAKLAGSRMVWYHRGDPDARGTSMIAPILADQIVSVSEYSLPRRRWGKLKSARVIHSPFDVSVSVDRADMRQRLIAELGCPDDAIICGYFGQYIVRKRPLAFMDAVAELERISDRPVVGVMFGEPKDAPLFAEMQQRLGSPGKTPPVQLMGYREPGHEWIGACDALLITALNEPLGRTLVEAMLVGTPVIATDSGGNAEAVAPDCGIIVPMDDAPAMARATLDLLNDPERRDALTQRARLMAEKRYTSEHHVAEVRKVYRELVGTLRRPKSHAGRRNNSSSFTTS